MARQKWDLAFFFRKWGTLNVPTVYQGFILIGENF